MSVTVYISPLILVLPDGTLPLEDGLLDDDFDELDELLVDDGVGVVFLVNLHVISLLLPSLSYTVIVTLLYSLFTVIVLLV